MAPSVDYLVSSLLCSEDNESICYDEDEGGFEGVWWGQLNKSQNQGFRKNLETECFVSDFPLQSDECLGVLIGKECEQFVGVFDYLNRLRNGGLDLGARYEAVDWITKVHAHFNFGPLCAYLSINYLDRFLAVYDLPAQPWMMQLLAIACLSLAAKVEETEIPLLLDLQVCESRFVFEAKTIQKMELLVLSTLKWRMQSVTPFSFVDSFLGRLCGGQPTSRILVSRSTQLILCLIKGIDFLELRPSEIAAAVAISVIGQTETSALFQLVEKERVLKCMELVKELSGGCTMSITSGTSTSTPQSPIGVLEAACFRYKTDDPSVESCVLDTPPAKKRRLNNTPFL